MSGEDEAILLKVVAEIEAASFDPPAWDKLTALRDVSRQKSKSLADLAKTDPRLVSFAPGQFASAGAIASFRDAVQTLGANGRRFKLAEVRDKTGQSRRVVQPLLEHLDRIGFTRRVGDERVVV
jgi:selenocysteine-specific elongation factor